MIAKILMMLTFLAFLSSCQTPGYFQTKEQVKPSEEFEALLLKDIVVTVKNNFLPAKTRLFFPHDGENLAGALETELRKYGYAVSRDEKSRKEEDVQLGYKLSEIEPKVFVLTVVLGESFQVNRIYQQTPEGEYLAAGPLLMRKG